MLEMQSTPSTGGSQAVCVNYGIFLPEGPCVMEGYDDHDDLIFSIAKGSGEMASPSLAVPPATHVVDSSIYISSNGAMQELL